jgi:hypothetical protein
VDLSGDGVALFVRVAEGIDAFFVIDTGLERSLVGGMNTLRVEDEKSC